LRLHISRRLRALTAALLTGAVVVTAGLVVGATPAQAATCVTEGHAYLTQPGKVYFSGYNGDNTLGRPRIIAFQGELFRLGGNGINPYPSKGTVDIRWKAAGPAGYIDFFPGVPTYHSLWAHDNCVVHEEGPFPVTAPPGTYRIYAFYTSGNHPDSPVLDEVAEMLVLPGLPPISSASQSTADAVSSTPGSESMMSSGYSEPPPGGGGGGDPDPPPCETCPPLEQ